MSLGKEPRQPKHPWCPTDPWGCRHGIAGTVHAIEAGQNNSDILVPLKVIDADFNEIGPEEIVPVEKTYILG